MAPDLGGWGGYFVSPWIWLLVGIILGVVELATTTFVLLWVAIAAAITGIAGFIIGNFLDQVAIFVLLSAILLIFTRPLAQRFKNRGAKYESNVQQLVGEKGLVISKIVAGKTGMVRVGSDMWSARGDEVAGTMEVGEWVRVKAAKSSILIVSKL